uniref:Mitochondrial rRNA methyltransferase 1 n=1 Tax=Malurus cyaneus samueli TaxID=2593467 RepID=A0A8C5U9Y4_9PASS
MEVFDVYGTDDLQGFLKAKSAEGWEVVGTVSRPEDVEDVPVISCSEFQWDKPIIVVIGIAISCAGCEGGVPPSKSVILSGKEKLRGNCEILCHYSHLGQVWPFVAFAPDLKSCAINYGELHLDLSKKIIHLSGWHMEGRISASEDTFLRRGL